VHRVDKLATSRVDCLEIWEPQPPRTLWVCNMPVQGLLHLCLTIHIYTHTQTPAYTHIHTQEHVRLHTHTRWTKNARRQKRNMLHDVRTNTKPLVIWFRS